MTKRPEEIALMAESGQLLADVFAYLDQMSLSAQFEHTVAVTQNGVRVLTLRSGETVPN